MRGVIRGGGLGLLALALLTLGARAAAASPLDLFGFGGRSPAMAGTGVSTATGFDATWINPAGLADVQRKRVTFGYMYGDFALNFDGKGTGTDPVQGLVFGGALPIPLGGFMHDRVGLGLGFHVPPNSINRARHPFPGDPVYELLETRGHVVGIQAAVGVVATDWLRVGFGVQALATLDGTIHVSTDAAGRFTTKSEQELITRFAPLIGARLRGPTRHTQLGLVLRGEAKTAYQIIVTNDLIKSLPLTVPTLTIGGTSQFDPLTVAAELAWEATGDVRVEGQLAWQNWSAYPLPTINPVMNDPPQDPPNFHDTVVPRLGVQWMLLRDREKGVALRGGYAFVPTPAPEATGRQSMLDNSRHVLSAGLGVQLPGTVAPLHLDVWMQLHLLVPRRNTKDLSNYGPDDVLPFYTIETGGHIVVGGATLGVDI